MATPYYKETGKFIEFHVSYDYGKENSFEFLNWRWNYKKQCWTNFNHQDNLDFAKYICQQYTADEPQNADDYTDNLDEVIIEMNDLIVRSNSFYCNKNHEITDFMGIFQVCNRYGDSKELRAPIAYCEDCDSYFILEKTYRKLKESGVILCKVIKYKDYISSNKHAEYSGWQEKSPLREWGYTTEQKDCLSDKQRRKILTTMIDREIMTKDAILSYLDFFVDRFSGIHPSSLSKWESDREYIASYSPHSMQSVRFKEIKHDLDDILRMLGKLE